ncbi:MAG: fructose-bisphosphate aldolase [Rubrobacter sp.]|jgi:DhnA family fructose-bisphosphate aldolase class Ia|nr:fructose-bisphosphate aldolase [Rubrobacter sp.]
MSGTNLRLGRLFDRESGRSFITAFDHGGSLRVPPESGGAVEVVERIVAGDPDGVLITPGLLKQSSHLFAFRGAPVPVVRADWTTLDERTRELGEHYRVLLGPADAASLGAGAVVMFLIHGPEEGAMFADNVAAVAEAASEARDAGIPLIVEATLWGSRVEDRKDPDLLAYICRMAAELGADAVKTEYTGDPATMAEVVEGCPVPILTLGGAKSGSEEAVVEAARGAIEGGAKGIIFGRNVWMADDPVGMSKALREVVHGVPVRR